MRACANHCDGQENIFDEKGGENGGVGDASRAEASVGH